MIQNIFQYLCAIGESVAQNKPFSGLSENQCQLILEQVSSCTISEFLIHMEKTPTPAITYPVPYWRKAFVNYLEESAFALVALG